MAKISLARADSGPAFIFSHRVTYSECTVGNHVYYSRYLDMLETARGAFFRQLGTTLMALQEQDVIFPVVECHLCYRKAARYDDLLQIELWITLAEGVRLNFGCRILNEESAIVLEGGTCHVCTGLSGKLRRLPQTLIEGVQPFCRRV